MFSVGPDGLKWVAQNLRPRWLWIMVTAGGALFSVWSAIPDKYQERLVDGLMGVAATKTVAAEIDVASFQIRTAEDEDVLWVRNKIERNIVEYFVAAGKQTTHEVLTVLKPGQPAPNRIVGSVSRVEKDKVEVSFQLVQTGIVTGSASIEASIDFFKTTYRALPEAFLYAIDVSPKTLRKLNSNVRPTQGTVAYAWYLHARDAVARSGWEEAVVALDQAVVADPKFAMAHWAASEILRKVGRVADADARAAKATEINRDHPRLPILAGVANPMPDLMGQLTESKWEQLEPGLKYRVTKVAAYDLQIHAWQAEVARYRVSIGLQTDEQGSSVGAIRLTRNAILAINGGFFEIDNASRLSPSGLLVTSGRRLSAYHQRGGSGILYETGQSSGIGWSKDHAALVNIQEALQAGPMVVDPGGRNGIKSNNQNRVNRAAICQDQSGKTMTFVVVIGGLSLYELGDVMAASEAVGGFGCDRALNLDGGPSTQADFHLGDRKISIDGTWRVQNAVLLHRRGG